MEQVLSLIQMSRESKTTTPDSIMAKALTQEKRSSKTSSKITLSILPPELILRILKEAGQVPSLCLGLANRQFYNLHKAQYDLTDLGLLSQRRISSGVDNLVISWETKGLEDFISEWMRKGGWIYKKERCMFVKKETLEDLDIDPWNKDLENLCGKGIGGNCGKVIEII